MVSRGASETLLASFEMFWLRNTCWCDRFFFWSSCCSLKSCTFDLREASLESNPELRYSQIPAVNGTHQFYFLPTAFKWTTVTKHNLWISMCFITGTNYVIQFKLSKRSVCQCRKEWLWLLKSGNTLDAFMSQCKFEKHNVKYLQIFWRLID